MYEPTVWVNDKSPDIDEDNLNKIEQGIKDAHDMAEKNAENIAAMAGNQMPEEYLKAAVDEYVNNNSAGFATQVSMEELESQLTDQIESVTSSLNSEIGNVTIDQNVDFWELGAIDATSGNNTDNSNRKRTPFYPMGNLKEVYSVGDTFFLVYFYDENQSLINKITEYTQRLDLTSYNATFIRIVIKNASDLTNANNDLFVRCFTDLSFSINGKSADAKEVGELIRNGGKVYKNLKELSPFSNGGIVAESGANYIDESDPNYALKRFRTSYIANGLDGIVITSNSSTFGVRAYYYDNNYSYIGCEETMIYNSRLVIPIEKAQNIRIVLYNDSTDLTIDEFLQHYTFAYYIDTDFNVTQPILLRVASYNVGHFADGKAYNPTYAEEELQDFRNVLAELKADVLLISENDLYFDSGNTMEIYNVLYRLFGYYNTHTKYEYNCNAICADYELKNVGAKAFTTKQQYRYFYYADIVINGKFIHLVVTQLDFYDVDKRKAQIEELIAHANQYEYCIIGGDMNPSVSVNGAYPDGYVGNEQYSIDYGMWLDAGYNIANGDYFGVMNTLKEKENDVAFPWDNIITSSNIQIKGVEVVKSEMSDHYPIVADLIIS